MILGKCPYCDNGHIEVRDKEVSGKKVLLTSTTTPLELKGYSSHQFSLLYYQH